MIFSRVVIALFAAGLAAAADDKDNLGGCPGLAQKTTLDACLLNADAVHACKAGANDWDCMCKNASEKVRCYESSGCTKGDALSGQQSTEVSYCGAAKAAAPASTTAESAPTAKETGATSPSESADDSEASGTSTATDAAASASATGNGASKMALSLAALSVPMFVAAAL